VDLNYTTGGGLIYGRTDPTLFDGGIAAQGSIQEDDFLMALSDKEQQRILAAADRINGVITDEKAQVLTTNHLGAIADAVLDDKTPLPGGGETSARTNVKYQKQEFDANKNLIKDLAAKVADLTSVVTELAKKGAV
jgi:hypothetical protein